VLPEARRNRCTRSAFLRDARPIASRISLDAPIDTNTLSRYLLLLQTIACPAPVSTPASCERGGRVTPDRREGSPRVTAINEALARRFFISDVPGRRLRAVGQDQELTVVGVVKMICAASLVRSGTSHSPSRPTFSVACKFAPRVSQDVGGRIPADYSKHKCRPCRERGEHVGSAVRSLASDRLIATVSGAFDVLAMMLVCIGLCKRLS
jgi:hypothetical protein